MVLPGTLRLLRDSRPLRKQGLRIWEYLPVFYWNTVLNLVATGTAVLLSHLIYDLPNLYLLQPAC